MSTEQKREELPVTEENFPSVELAYPIGLKAYEIAIQRIEVRDQQIAKLLAWVTTVTLAAVPFIFAQFKPPVQSGWLALALVFFAGVVGRAYKSMTMDGVTVLSPMSLFQNHLHREKWDFQAFVLQRAGEAFEQNNEFLERKFRSLKGMVVMFALEVAMLVAWALSAP
jgi:hypothetical protein